MLFMVELKFLVFDLLKQQLGSEELIREKALGQVLLFMLELEEL